MQRDSSPARRLGLARRLAPALIAMSGGAAACPIPSADNLSSDQAETCTFAAGKAWAQGIDCSGPIPGAIVAPECAPAEFAGRPQVTVAQTTGSIPTTDGKSYFVRWIEVTCGARSLCSENLDPINLRAFSFTFRAQGDASVQPDEIDETCPVSHAVRPGSGEERREESDLELDRLAFRRYYSSNGYTHFDKRGLASYTPQASPYPFWSHSYAARVFALSSSDDAIAVAVRSDLRYKRFGADGVEIGAIEGGRDRLERLVDAGGAVQGWRYVDSAEGNVETYDAGGSLLSIVARDGYAQQLTYAYVDAQPRLTRVSDSYGRALQFSYDANGRLSGVQTPTELSLSYIYDDKGNLLEARYVTASATQRRRYQYDDSAFPRLLTGIVDENERRHLTFRYDNWGRLAEEYLGGGSGRVRLSYTPGQTTLALPEGKTVVYSHSRIGNVRKVTATSESCSACDGGEIQRSFDARGFLDFTVDAAGNRSDTDYDARGLLQRKIDYAGSTTVLRTRQIDWHPDFDLPTQLRSYDASGHLVSQSAYAYNARGQLLSDSRLDPAGAAARTTTYSYCEQPAVDAGSCPRVGLLLAVDGPRNDVDDTTRYVYRAADDPTCAAAPATCRYRKGDLWKTVDALGHTIEVTAYDGAGRVRSVRDRNGVATDFEYDPRGWLTAKKIRGDDPSGESDDRILRIEYWPTGLVKRLTQPDGARLSYEYDDAHRLVAVADDTGNRLSFTLDDAGRHLAETATDGGGALRRTLARAYDTLGRLQQETDAYGHVTHYGYDVRNNPDVTTDALGRRVDSDYDPLGRLVRVLQDVDGVAAETKLEYDADDNLVRIVDPKGLPTDYGYDAFGDQTSQNSPDTGAQTFRHDAAGNRIGRTDARGLTANYAYDALNRLTATTYPADASLAVTRRYDEIDADCQPGETFALGRLSRMDDAGGSTRYCYDRFGAVVRRILHSEGRTFTLRWSYLPNGRLSQMSYPDGTVIDYAHDDGGRIREIGLSRGGRGREQILRDASYHPFGPIAGWTFGNGRSLRRDLDRNYQPETLTDSGPGGFALRYAYDAAGNLEQLRIASTGTPLRNYRHDALDRLTEVRDGADDALLHAYAYDASGNRLSEGRWQTVTSGGGPGDPPGSPGTTTTQWAATAYAYANASHRLLGVGGEPRRYDAAGNLVEIGDPGAPGGARKSFVYDAAGRLRQVGEQPPLASYRYNGHGERVLRSTSDGVVHTVYDERGRWLGDYDGQGVPRQQMIWLNDLPVAVLSNEAGAARLYYLAADAIGTVRAVIDPQREPGGTVVWRWDLAGEPFGADAPQQDPDGDGVAFVFDQRFPGQRHDAASGLDYNYFRDYEPGSGRYATSDPAGLAGGLSTYAYVAGQPMDWTDTLGLGRNGGTSGSANFSSGAGGNAAQRRQTTREFLRQGTGDLDYLHDPYKVANDQLRDSLSGYSIYSEYICTRVICFRRQKPGMCMRGDGYYEEKFWGDVTLEYVNRLPGCRCERAVHISTLTEPQVEGTDIAELLARQMQLRSYYRSVRGR